MRVALFSWFCYFLCTGPGQATVKETASWPSPRLSSRSNSTSAAASWERGCVQPLALQKRTPGHCLIPGPFLLSTVSDSVPTATYLAGSVFGRCASVNASPSSSCELSTSVYYKLHVPRTRTVLGRGTNEERKTKTRHLCSGVLSYRFHI